MVCFRNPAEIDQEIPDHFFSNVNLKLSIFEITIIYKCSQFKEK